MRRAKAPRKHADPALYQQFVSASHLMRTLRTQALLDVPSNMLLSNSATEPGAGADEEMDIDERGDSSRARTSRPIRTRSEDASRRNRHSYERVVPFEHGPSMSTLWPSIPEETHVPEWSFREEVEALVRSCLKELGMDQRFGSEDSDDHDHGAASAENHPAAELLGSQEQPRGSRNSIDVPSSYIETLTSQTTLALSRIFSYMADHREATKPKNYIFLPKLGWNEVLGIMQGSGIVDDS